MSDYKHWKLDTDENKILWLTIDRQDSKVNSLNDEVLSEFNTILDHIPSQKPAGVVIRSAKKSGFIAGADIEQFVQIKDINEAISLLRKGQKVFDKLERLPVKTVAMIKGFCMGGGTELSLACKYRVALDDDSTRIGLPEVKLGIHPGWGGSVRLPRLIGAVKAMSVMLPGSAIRAKAAQRMGMVDAAVPERHLERAAVSYILGKTPPRQLSFSEKLPSFPLVRSFVVNMLNKQLRAKKVNPTHYPAPYALVKSWAAEASGGESAYITEANSVGELLITPTSRNLVKVFFLQNKLKELAKGVSFAPKHVHVIGAGTMGGDIAAWCALKGFTVTLQDREPKFIAPAIKRAYKLYEKQLKEWRPVQEAMDRLTPDPEGLGVKKADLIIEAIYENLEAKQKLFKELEEKAKPTAVLASNTSSIPLAEISTVMKDASRLVGIHFFNPVAMMPLVEVVKSASTDPEVVKQAIKFVSLISKSPIPVKSSPGFLVNRVLLAYMTEAMSMLDEGVSGPMIDKAATDFGMPMGPIELGDTVGLDICLSVVKNLTAAFGGTVPTTLVTYVEKGDLGKKTGRGFYAFDKAGKPIKAAVSGTAPADLQTRMFGRMLNECVACLREGVVENTELLDAGMIFGTGFAPFRGGPIQYARDRGVQNIVHELQELASRYGDRFKPDQGWEMVK